MSAYMRCDRCGIVCPPDEQCTWMTLVIKRSEDQLLSIPSDQIDLCLDCERDMVKWMAKPLVESIGKKP